MIIRYSRVIYENQIRIWIADSLSLPSICISLLLVISSYAEKNFSNALEILHYVFVDFSICLCSSVFVLIHFHHKRLAKVKLLVSSILKPL